jgi:hypothetical protein
VDHCGTAALIFVAKLLEQIIEAEVPLIDAEVPLMDAEA